MIEPIPDRKAQKSHLKLLQGVLEDVKLLAQRAIPQVKLLWH
jgi:hypothetical protein